MSSQIIGTNTQAAQDLKTYVERIERINTEIDALKADVRDIRAEAKGNGFDVGTINKIVTIRRKARSQVQEEFEQLKTYANAIGLPLFLDDKE